MGKNNFINHPPSHNFFYRCYVYHSQSWVVYGIVLPTFVFIFTGDYSLFISFSFAYKRMHTYTCFNTNKCWYPNIVGIRTPIYIILYYTILYYIKLNYIILYCIIFYYIVLYYIILYYILLYYIILYYII